MKEENFVSVWREFIKKGAPSVDFITPFSTFKKSSSKRKNLKGKEESLIIR